MFLSSNSCFCDPSSCAVSFKETLLLASDATNETVKRATARIPPPFSPKENEQLSIAAVPGIEQPLKACTGGTTAPTAEDGWTTVKIKKKSRGVPAAAASPGKEQDNGHLPELQLQPCPATPPRSKAQGKRKKKAAGRLCKTASIYAGLGSPVALPPLPCTPPRARAGSLASLPPQQEPSRPKDSTTKVIQVGKKNFGMSETLVAHFEQEDEELHSPEPMEMSNPFDLLTLGESTEAEELLKLLTSPEVKTAAVDVAIPAVPSGSLAQDVLSEYSSDEETDCNEEPLIDSLEEYGCFVEEDFAGQQMKVLKRTSGKPLRSNKAKGRHAVAKRQRSLALERASKALTASRNTARHSKEARLDASLPSPLAPETALFPLPCSPKAAAPAATCRSTLSFLPVKVKIEEEASVEGFYAGCVSFQPEVQPLPPLPLSLNRFDVLDNEPAEMELPEPAKEQTASTEEDCSSEGLFWKTLRVVGGIIARGAAVAVTVCGAVKRFFCWGQ